MDERLNSKGLHSENNHSNHSRIIDQIDNYIQTGENTFGEISSENPIPIFVAERQLQFNCGQSSPVLEFTPFKRYTVPPVSIDFAHVDAYEVDRMPTTKTNRNPDNASLTWTFTSVGSAEENLADLHHDYCAGLDEANEQMNESIRIVEEAMGNNPLR